MASRPTDQDREFERRMMAKYGLTQRQLQRPTRKIAELISLEAGLWLVTKEREERELQELAALI